MARIGAEAALLAAVSDDSLTEASDVAPELLALVVKPTFNDPEDRTAFYHSVASFGLDFVIGENITQLAKRNGMMEAFRVLDAMEKKLGLQPPRPLGTEAQLLTAVSQDNGEEARKLLACPHKEMLLKLRVKETFQDASDTTAFYHSVATYGLRFELGDTLAELARRNGRLAALASLQPGQRRFEVVVRNAVTGKELVRLPAHNWNLGQVSQEVASQSPGPGCRIFLKGSAALSWQTPLADLEMNEGLLELGCVVRAEVSGSYFCTLPGEDDAMAVPGRLGPGLRIRPKPARLQLQLEDDGSAKLAFEQHPVDRGHCAGSFGGCWVHASGVWSFEVPGLRVEIRKGVSGNFQRGLRSQESPWKQQQVLRLAMVQKDHFEVVSNTAGVSSAGSPIRCPNGSAFVKGERRSA